MLLDELEELGDLVVATDEARGLCRKVAWHDVNRLQRREVDAQALGADLIDRQRFGEVPESTSAEVDQIDHFEELVGGFGNENLAAVGSRHDPCGSVQRRVEVVAPLRHHLARRKAHPNRQLEQPLRVDGRLDGIARVNECCTDSVAGVLEQPPTPRLDRGS